MTEQKTRECGDCAGCCKTLAVVELHKPAGTWCGHCTTRKKCDIYPQRPGSCRDHLCWWRAAPAGEFSLPDDEKPSIVRYECSVTDIMLGNKPYRVCTMREISVGALRSVKAQERIRTVLGWGWIVETLKDGSRSPEFLHPKGLGPQDNMAIWMALSAATGWYATPMSEVLAPLQKK